MNKKFSLDFELPNRQQPPYSSSTCQFKKKLKTFFPDHFL